MDRQLHRQWKHSCARKHTRLANVSVFFSFRYPCICQLYYSPIISSSLGCIQPLHVVFDDDRGPLGLALGNTIGSFKYVSMSQRTSCRQCPQLWPSVRHGRNPEKDDPIKRGRRSGRFLKITHQGTVGQCPSTTLQASKGST